MYVCVCVYSVYSINAVHTVHDTFLMARVGSAILAIIPSGELGENVLWPTILMHEDQCLKQWHRGPPNGPSNEVHCVFLHHRVKAWVKMTSVFVFDEEAARGRTVDIADTLLNKYIAAVIQAVKAQKTQTKETTGANTKAVARAPRG